MSKFNLREKFATALDRIGSEVALFFWDTRDNATLSDEFAKVAFKRAGFVVQKRENVTHLNQDALFDGTQVEYLLKKKEDDGRDYLGTIVTGRAFTPGVAAMRSSWVSGDIKLKK